MYRGSNFTYGHAPRRRGQIPVQGFLSEMGYGDPYFNEDPYGGMGAWIDPYYNGGDDLYENNMMGNYPRQRMPSHGRNRHVSEWGRNLVKNQINKAQQKILSQNLSNENNAAETSSEKKTEVSQKSTGTSLEVNNNSEAPPKPIGPRISAKQMWESSYVETVKEEREAKKNEPPIPVITIENAPAIKQTNKKTNKRGKFKNRNRRGPYFNRKKKPTAASEAAAKEPGFGFDVNGENTEETTEEIGGFPKMCQVCNVQLSGQGQADDHYKGETHKRNINNFITGQDKPTLATKLDKINDSLPLPTNTPECLAWSPDTGDRTLNTVRFCRLCSVRMSSLPNAKQHYEGKSHAKRIRLVQHGKRPARKPFKPTAFVSGGVLGVQPKPVIPSYTYNPTYNTFVQPQDPTPHCSINLKPSLPAQFVHSMTPSGQYYCQTCNTVIQHAGELNKHLESKEHKQAKARS